MKYIYIATLFLKKLEDIGLLTPWKTFSFIFLNETAINVMRFHSNAFGGIRLQVHQKDKERAIQIIREINNTSKLEIV